MNVIVPLNIQALRVSLDDTENITSNFCGQTALFQDLPYYKGESNKLSSTGDSIYNPLLGGGGDGVQSLQEGIHLHWDLPDYFKKGKQHHKKAKIEFPQVHNRWLVTRFLSVCEKQADQSYKYVAKTPMSWVVESDYISSESSTNGRRSIAVPLKPQSGDSKQPFMYMGRTVKYDDWITETPDESKYLSSYDQQYLDSIGFVGSYFSSYYPECSSVFGFHDNFSDQSTLHSNIMSGSATKFKVSYSVIGWVDSPSKNPLKKLKDPVNKFKEEIITQYNDYVDSCKSKGVQVVETPADFFNQMMKRETDWSYNKEAIQYSLKPSKKIDSIEIPTKSICSGIMQEIVWDQMSDESTPFLGQNGNAAIETTGNISMGNTTVEAMSALLRGSKKTGQTTADQKKNELMLDALQLGMLKDLENNPDTLISLEEKLHSDAFNHHDGGLVWKINNTQKNASETLDDSIATLLNTLNTAQKAYDQSRFGLYLKRKQLFMDWFRYIKLYSYRNYNTTHSNPYPKLHLNQNNVGLNPFLFGQQAEILDVANYAKNTLGELDYKTDSKSGNVISITNTPANGTKALDVKNAFQNLYNAIESNANLHLHTEALDRFHTPSDPVLLLETEALNPNQRKPLGGGAFVRFSNEILTQINITQGSKSGTIKATQINASPGIPQFSTKNGMPSEVQDLINEMYLLCPTLASSAMTGLVPEQGANAFTISDADQFILDLMTAQGGLSPLDFQGAAAIAKPSQKGLYEQITQEGNSLKNPTVEVPTSGDSIQFQFTNTSTHGGYVMSPYAWNAQSLQKQLINDEPNRVDPFIPLFIIWGMDFYPLVKNTPSSTVTKKGKVTVNQAGYNKDNIKDYFDFDSDQTDYQYLMTAGKPKDFSVSIPQSYSYSATLSPNAALKIIKEIQDYNDKNPTDLDHKKLTKMITELTDKKIISQRMSSFNDQQILTKPVAGIKVDNLRDHNGNDQVTGFFKHEIESSADNWYAHQFNRLAPISNGPSGGFNPLRAGFTQLTSVQIVDVFGQIVEINLSKNGGSSFHPSFPISPIDGDTTHDGQVYLPPRILSPSRLWFKWISAQDNLVEMAKEPISNPINGWIVPNHLDNSLVFYNANGSGIGSFRIDGNDSLKYYTWPGNPSNNTLSDDIGQKGQPAQGINAHLAFLMHYVKDQGVDIQFFKDLMASIQKSEDTNIPKDYQESQALSVLMGRPLAITRAEIGLESQGGLLPLDQSALHTTSAFCEDVSKDRYKYTDRMEYSSSNLSEVNVPVQLGNIAHYDDGVVGYLIEGSSSDPYSNANFLSPAAIKTQDSKVLKPTLDTMLPLSLNKGNSYVTVIADPRGYIHATTGILPVKKLKLPANFYKEALNKISVSFTTRPILRGAHHFNIPIPKESGYEWEWILEKTPNLLGDDQAQPITKMKAQKVGESPQWGYSKQSLQEGWLNLKPKQSE
ncbi:hypothetical protein [Pseudotenacibaculum haliotis]|uniref:Uncharacterized protein n=1 Tax=Pseudotenacibaculum haliotis TaxID=1862138 RepID=A0ABW5LX56_9FLAO